MTRSGAVIIGVRDGVSQQLRGPPRQSTHLKRGGIHAQGHLR